MGIQVVFFSNFINHHQVLLCDELYKQLSGNFIFVETTDMPAEFKRNGYADYSKRSYVLQAWKNEESYKQAEELAISADVAMVGSVEPFDFLVLRSKNTNKLTFEVSERWLKRGLINLLSPNLLKYYYYYYTLFYRKPVYQLCCSSYASNDFYFMHSYIDKCYKWAYFTKVDNINLQKDCTRKEPIQIMWCSRFLKLKHAELPVLMAAKLKKEGYKFILNMYGSGEKLEVTKELVRKHNLEDIVNFCGNLPNDELLLEMRNHSIFLFTSDQNEGWGAVANEAMSNGCVLVASKGIGSSPFLIDDGVTGLHFRSPRKSTGFGNLGLFVDKKALDSLYEKVKFLLDNPNEIERLSTNAYKSMVDVWNPKNAAKSLLKLINAIQRNEVNTIKQGPCSKALPIK